MFVYFTPISTEVRGAICGEQRSILKSLHRLDATMHVLLKVFWSEKSWSFEVTAPYKLFMQKLSSKKCDSKVIASRTPTATA